MLAETPTLVDENARRALPEVPISLATALRNGVTDFAEMGLDRAYAGDPAAATVEEGEALSALLAEMIATEIRDAM